MTLRERRSRRLAWLLLSPALGMLALLTLYPALWVLWLSLQERIPIFGIARFVGLAHYVFLATDVRFLAAARTTALFTAVSVMLETVLGVGAAVAIASLARGHRSALSLLLLAWAMPAVVTARMFEWLYHPAAGLVNYLLGRAALNWLGDPHLALPAVIGADVWRTMPFVAVLAYARLLGIPRDVYEAAQVDGAGRLGIFTRVTLPLLRRVLLIAVLLRTLDAIRAFDIMFVLTGGGPAGSTETLTVYAYRAIFQMLQFGFGSAIGVVVLAAVMTVAVVYLRTLHAPETGA